MARGRGATRRPPSPACSPPGWRDLTLLAITIGAIAANAINIYSGAISFTAIGIKLPLPIRRAIVALGFGTIGFFLAWSGLSDAGTKYNNFLLIIAYWIAPVAGGRVLRHVPAPPEVDRARSSACSSTRSTPTGPARSRWLIGAGVSIWLFANQTEYVGVIPNHWPSAGDLTFEVGFVLTAVIYLTWRLIAERSARASAAAPAEPAPQV